MIRYDFSLNKEINRLVRNYNAKISRLEKKGLEVPKKISKTDLKKKFTKRSDLKRELKEIEYFTRRGSEASVQIKNDTIPKYEFHRIKGEVRRAKYKLSRQITIEGNKPFIFEGRKTSATVKEFQTTEFKNLQAKRQALNKDLRKLTRGELSKLSSRSRGDISGISEKDKSLYWNYWDAINDLGLSFGVDDEKIEYIRKRLFSLGLSGFTKAFNNEQILKDLLSFYIPTYFNNLVVYGQAFNDVQMLFNELYVKVDTIVDNYS